MRLYFWLIQTLFTAHPLIFHAVSLLLHLINSFLVWLLINRLTKNSLLSWLAAFLFATSSLHFMSLFWIAETGLVMGILAYLLVANLYLNYLHRPSPAAAATITLFTILALLTHEFAITLPATLWLLSWYSRQLKKSWRLILTVGVLSLIYTGFRLINSPPLTGTYAPQAGLITLKTIFWYVLWSFNIIENLRDQMLPGMAIHPQFFRTFPLVSYTIVTTLVALVIFIIGIPILYWLKAKVSTQKQITRLLVFCLAWFTINITLPLLAPRHSYPMYASLSLVGLVTFMAAVFRWLYPRTHLATALLIIAWMFTSYLTLTTSEKIHWTVQEAKRVNEVFTKAKATYPQLPTGSTIVIEADYQIREALYGDLGMQWLYHDPTITTYFGLLPDIVPQECRIESELYSCLKQHKIFVLYQDKTPTKLL